MSRAPKWKVGDTLIDGRGWKRTIFSVVENYLDKPGQFGYYYTDENGYPMCCSEAHMTRIGYVLENAELPHQAKAQSV